MLKMRERDFYSLYARGIPYFYDIGFTLNTEIPNLKIIPYSELTFEQMKAIVSYPENSVNPIFSYIIELEAKQRAILQKRINLIEGRNKQASKISSVPHKIREKSNSF